MKQTTKLIVRNIVILGFLVFSMNALALAGTQFYYEWLYPLAYLAEAYMLPNYDGAEWAKTHFLEFNDLDSAYMAYYGWRRSPYSGETIHIDDRGLRQTYRDQTVTPKRTIAFFGGSTMWGSGADDDRTIPSEFVKLNHGIKATISARWGMSPTRVSTFSSRDISNGFDRTWWCSTTA